MAVLTKKKMADWEANQQTLHSSCIQSTPEFDKKLLTNQDAWTSRPISMLGQSPNVQSRPAFDSHVANTFRQSRGRVITMILLKGINKLLNNFAMEKVFKG